MDEESTRLGGGARESPILVVDRNGGSQAATFCNLMSLWHQVEILMYIGWIHPLSLGFVALICYSK